MLTGIVEYPSSDSADEEEEISRPKITQIHSEKNENYKPESEKKSQLNKNATTTNVGRERGMKRKQENSLPLPSSIFNMFKQERRTEEKHCGRLRSFEHVEGNWATYLFIPYCGDERFICLVDEVIKCLRPLNFESMTDFHLSLSRTVTIRHHWIESLTESLRSKFHNINRFMYRQPFWCLFLNYIYKRNYKKPTVNLLFTVLYFVSLRCICSIMNMKFYTNDESTRTFLSLQVSDSWNRLKLLTSLIDESFDEFKLEKYYENPSYHISIGWCLGNVVNDITEQQRSHIQELVTVFLEENDDLCYIDVNKINCKTGNKTFTFHLENR